MATTAVPEEHKGLGTTIKEAFSSAPWADHHDKTLEALTHAKAAHMKASKAQASLKAAAESKQKAEAAQRHLAEVRDTGAPHERHTHFIIAFCDA
jgi:hypothetical protein